MSGIDGSNRVTNSTESNKLGLAAIATGSDYSNGVWCHIYIYLEEEKARALLVAWRANKGVTLEETRIVVDRRLDVALKSWRLAQDMVGI